MAQNTDIAQQIESLVKLQEIDTQIYKLKAEKEAMPNEMKVLKDSLSSKQSGLKQAEDTHKSFQLKRKEKEGTLQAKEEDIKKHQAQLYQLKTNKEYTAKLHEIEGIKADNSLLEEEIIKLMDSIDAAEKKVAEEKVIFAQEAKKVDEKVAEVEKRVKEIEAIIADLDKKRQELTPSVDANILKDYERVLSGKGGLAIVEVINDSCEGCYMQMPPQVINEIRMKEKIIRCESCQRILYIKNDQAN